MSRLPTGNNANRALLHSCKGFALNACNQVRAAYEELVHVSDPTPCAAAVVGRGERKHTACTAQVVRPLSWNETGRN